MAELILSDGTVFAGQTFGASVDTDGEVVFNTGMVGYPESLTDPSYRGQILVFTYPLIGNYGVPSEELNEWGFSKNFESEAIHVRGVVMAQASEEASHFTAVSTLHRWLEHHKIPAITGVDTRALTKKLREHGVMLGKLCHGEKWVAQGDTLHINDPNEKNLVAEVSCKEVITYEPTLRDAALCHGEGSAKADRLEPSHAAPQGDTPITVIAYDCGMKRGIIRSFLNRGVKVVRVPWDFDLDSYREPFDGVFISNGPGDPKQCTATIKAIARAIERNIPTFGICLGNQLMALAVGGDTYKLKYGHRGANQPCILCHGEPDESMTQGVSILRQAQDDTQNSQGDTHRCIITSQNHGFAVNDKLPKDWSVWFRNANDQTVEGIRHVSGRFFAVQFHPEATPGPEDANYLFDDFLAVMRA